ncbi:lipase [Purpureocillium lavendulum]|uniref:Lipase n=1 Tax=Purpureocillium lavendulum TaxID=1247861 RepID=A0AB34FN90_9HYPO|nr:lipase [Purpureocillium lavendulum]
MKLSAVPVCLGLAASAFAADCLGGNYEGKPSTSAYWEARKKMCSNQDGCLWQQPCTTYGKEAFPQLGSGINFYVSLTRSNYGGAKGFKDCLDATRDMINQCHNGDGSYDSTWSYNGQYFKFHAYPQ